MNKIVILTHGVLKSIFLGILVLLAITGASLAAADPAPCAVNSENRQLDYWLGNWKIGAEGSSGNAHSTVSLSLDKCLVIENWDGGKGHRGQNVFGYSADDKSWYGMFAETRVGSMCSLRAGCRQVPPNLKARAADPTERTY